MLLSYGSFWALFFAFVLPALCANPYYVIIPKSENDQKTNDEVNDDIVKRAGDAGKVFRSSSDNTEIGTLYWWAALSDADKKDLQGQTDKVRQWADSRLWTLSTQYGLHVYDLYQIRLVEDIGILPYRQDDISTAPKTPSPSTSPTRRRRLSRRKITSQKGPTPYHLKTICQAKDVKLKDIDSYYYDESAGVSTHLYIIDSGMRETHQVMGASIIVHYHLLILKRNLLERKSLGCLLDHLPRRTRMTRMPIRTVTALAWLLQQLASKMAVQKDPVSPWCALTSNLPTINGDWHP